MLLALTLWAEENAAQQPQSGPGPMLMNMLLFGGIFLLMWMFLFRPARRQEQERQQFLSQLEKNDRVLTSAGFYGHIVSVNANEGQDEVTIKIDDNVKVKMTRASIVRNLTKEEKAKAAQPAAQPAAGAAPASAPPGAFTEKK